MKKPTTVYGDLLSPLKQINFTNIVRQYQGDCRVRRLSTFDLLKAGIYGHTIAASGLREIVTSLAANKNALYHCGLKRVCLSTLSDALAKRDWRILRRPFTHCSARSCCLRTGKSGISRIRWKRSFRQTY